MGIILNTLVFNPLIPRISKKLSQFDHSGLSWLNRGNCHTPKFTLPFHFLYIFIGAFNYQLSKLGFVVGHWDCIPKVRGLNPGACISIFLPFFMFSLFVFIFLFYFNYSLFLLINLFFFLFILLIKYFC